MCWQIMDGNNQELLPSTLHDHKNSSDVKSELCVPDDNLADIELFPNFANNWISLTGLLHTPEYDPLFSFDKTDDLWRFSFDEVDAGDDLWNFSQDTLEGKPHISLSPLPVQKIERQDSLAFSSVEQEIGGTSRINEQEIGGTSSGEMIVQNIEQKIGGTLSSSEMNMIVSSTKHNEKLKVYNNDIGGSKKSRNKLKSRFRRRCSHCEAEKTPQWRMGPDGPNTLCNACGVRYKQGRLVSDYRPSASPTFDTRKHSNFHRKILKKKKIYEDEYDAGEVLDA